MLPDRAARALDAGPLRARLADWEGAGRLRTPTPAAAIDLFSNDYLQLSSHPDVVTRFAEGVLQSGAVRTGVAGATLDQFADVRVSALREAGVPCAVSS